MKKKRVLCSFEKLISSNEQKFIIFIRKTNFFK